MWSEFNPWDPHDGAKVGLPYDILQPSHTPLGDLSSLWNPEADFHRKGWELKGHWLPEVWGDEQVWSQEGSQPNLGGAGPH